VPVYVVATLVGLVSPVASAILYAVVAAFYVVESSVFGRSRSRSRSPTP
jgi:hypothetical protein